MSITIQYGAVFSEDQIQNLFEQIRLRSDETKISLIITREKDMVILSGRIKTKNNTSFFIDTSTEFISSSSELTDVLAKNQSEYVIFSYGDYHRFEKYLVKLKHLLHNKLKVIKVSFSSKWNFDKYTKDQIILIPKKESLDLFVKDNRLIIDDCMENYYNQILLEQSKREVFGLYFTEDGKIDSENKIEVLYDLIYLNEICRNWYYINNGEKEEHSNVYSL